MLLTPEQLQQVSKAVHGLTPAQLAWVSGYLSGLSSGMDQQFTPFAHGTAVAAPLAANTLKTTIVYGSQTGNSKKIAEQLHARLQSHGAEAVVLNLKDYRPQQLKKEQRLIAVISTHGNGEPPDDARAFFSFLLSERAPRLEALEYAVLALGDSSYEEFCQTGLVLDQRLAELGAKPLLARVECDVDFATPSAEWQQQIVQKTPNNKVDTSIQFASAHTATATQGREYTADNPFQSELLSSINLTDSGSSKDVLHLEFSLEDSGLQYEPGDILAVAVANDLTLVEEVLSLSGLDRHTPVNINGQVTDLYNALVNQRELSTLTRRQMKMYAEYIGHAELLAAANDKNNLKEWLYAADWADVFRQFPGKVEAQALVDILRPLQPRQYSIASSPNAHPDEVHLLVKRVEYDFNGRTHLGAASNWLARLQAGDKAAVHIKPNVHFKLPASADSKIIMIGAGTGVAPFRSFLFEREAQGISGNSWLFFGEQRFRTDFLYQTEWQQFLANGTLERMSVAFSRDQARKVYVQHRLLEEAAEVYQWLQEGAYLYVCGDMNGMAKDVHNALIEIVASQRNINAVDAAAWLEQLMGEHRYQRDVY